MKVVVIAGNGLIGKKLVKNLLQQEHEVIAASRSTGVNTVTGEGLAKALLQADVVVDVANSPSFEEKAALDFFKASGENIFAAEKANHVKHHIALSVVGTERLLASGYFRAKMLQEDLIKGSKIPYTILRATQFFEFVGDIAQSATQGNTVRLPHALFQPIAADDVAALLTDLVNEDPLDGMLEVAGPDKAPLDEMISMFLKENQDKRTVIRDDEALYFGLKLNDQSLVPGANACIGPIHFKDWLKSKKT